ncbi:hypothetical protein BKK42_04330 [Bacillus cereus]|uniref:class I SAM-dependent methyltransferase n=1 Tax=Bacillus paramycoides TaxID=2026194 RepID=UPI000977F2A4|nr:hypothetical protein BKK43_10085 [Bacillus cereus]ONG86957.1 hypothetical protein BKK42_04330 [Bacillus cereus]
MENTKKLVSCSIPNPINIAEQEEWYKTYFGKDYWELVEYSCSTIEVTEGELSFLRPHLKKHNVNKVLDLCCGIGRHSNQLAQEGFDVTAIDINSDSLELAKSLQSSEKPVNYILGDVKNIKLEQNYYDAVLLMQTSFGYFSDEENNDLIYKIKNSLNTNGIIIIDIPNRDGMLKNFSRRDWAKVNNKTFCISHQFDYINSRRNTTMNVLNSTQENEYFHSIRMYTITEIKSILESNNFEILNFYGDFSKEFIRYDNNFRRLQIIAKKTT